MPFKLEPLISARAVSFSYADQNDIIYPALDGVNLDVGRGEYLALLGPNGSGKTTLLKLFNALLIPSEGEVLVKGISTFEADNLFLIRQTCGMIFQNPDNQIVATTVEEDIAFGLENLVLPPSEIRSRVNTVSELLGLTDLLQQPPHLLSGGEKQRTAIAGILAMRPECILMDEPTAMLDPAGRRDVLEAVRLLNKEEQIALIHVTHVPEEAAEADRIVVLDQGKIAAEGTPRIILSDLDLLHRLGLRGTVAAELAALIRKDGFPIPSSIFQNRELVKSLCSLALKS
jgi:energy-coupling factor transport system ATP-binding protein